jgi:hypothetical protein
VVLRDLRVRGLKPWHCTIADGHLGIWAALAEQQPMTAEQRCWHHWSTKVLGVLRYQQRAQAGTPWPGQCAQRDRPVAPRGVEWLAREGERLVTFDPFPAIMGATGDHQRGRAPCAAARLRTSAAPRVKTVEAATAVI